MTRDEIPDAAVEAAWDAYVVNAHNDPMRAALGAALPHLVAERDMVNAALLDELKRSDVQPLLKAANEGAAEIVRLNALLAQRDARIKMLEEALQEIDHPKQTGFCAYETNSLWSSLVLRIFDLQKIAHTALENPHD